MLVLASAVFLYYSVWTLLMVCCPLLNSSRENILMNNLKPFVDEKHPVQSLFPPRVWAIRIPVILILLGGAVVGSFLSLVMIRSNRKKALKKAQAAKAK